MTSRALQKSTPADEELHKCLNASPPRSFLMIAGAGSGKTTSLIKGLAEILAGHGEKLRLRRQRVACITYTEIAAGEIWADVGNNPLIHVATIHSFLWSLVQPFQSDIQGWVRNRIEEKITELRDVAAKFGPRVQQRTRDKNQADILRFEQQRVRIKQVRAFTYGMGSDYVNGILGHDDIVKMVPQLIVERPLMRSLIAQQYPFVFVDESQDTTESVVLALKSIDAQLGAKFCLGFFGDPMQRIYPTGIGAIPAGPGWATITKPENFRCPPPVLDVANAIRRDGDGLVQTRGRRISAKDSQIGSDGSANIFILPIDGRRDDRIAQVRTWLAKKTGDVSWIAPAVGVDAIKLLVIVHRMAAKRLGFGDLYAALNDKAPDTFKNGFLDGTAWPVRPFNRFVLPLVEAMRRGDEFASMQILRSQSPLLDRKNLNGVDVADLLHKLRDSTESLRKMMEENSGATNADVLHHLHQSGLVVIDPRILSYLNLPVPIEVEGSPADTDDDEDVSKEVSAMDAFLACPAFQFSSYYRYVNDASPFSTQQGVKGAEFERVLVILDDDEGTHVQFSYDKYLGIKPLSDRDEANIRENKETSVERTRRLFYVCCTRALKDLVVVLFTADVSLAKRRVLELGLFPVDAIHSEEALLGTMG
jgi:DNA helicase II / ATP-dependent DNA helicase PcrA